jgi:hypothetical protein
VSCRNIIFQTQNTGIKSSRVDERVRSNLSFVRKQGHALFPRRQTRPTTNLLIRVRGLRDRDGCAWSMESWAGMQKLGNSWTMTNDRRWISIILVFTILFKTAARAAPGNRTLGASTAGGGGKTPQLIVIFRNEGNGPTVQNKSVSLQDVIASRDQIVKAIVKDLLC